MVGMQIERVVVGVNGNHIQLQPCHDHVKAMVLFGETAPKLKQLGIKANISTIRDTENVQTAVQAAYEISEQNDVILL